ncbi:GDYXXLXY domain-containing protein [Bacillus daqingensis]|uniref:GDYXXLXY domain-containing protein n=1 Tax=Bacillus daqingensis TaxID=872396 RepID=A0ABV9NRN0_9BACI
MKNWVMPALQTLFTVLVITSFFAVSWFGESFTLRAEPYDPFDPFLGEYVMLQYPDLETPAGLQHGQVYFTLTEGEDGYAVIDQADDRPFFGAIEGYSFDQTITAPQLEQFYVEQGTGPELEREENLQVTIDVAPWGAIRPIELDVRNE